MQALVDQRKLHGLAAVGTYVLVPAAVITVAFNSGFLDGFIEDYDEGIHLAAINAMFNGKALYRNVYVVLGPLLEYTPAFLMKLFGSSLTVLRTYYYVGNILSALLAYFLCTRVVKNRSALFSALALLLIADANVTSYWASRWGGIRLGLGICVLLCFSFYLRSYRRRWLYLAGLGTSLAFFTSQEIGLLSLATSIVFMAALRFVRFDDNAEGSGVGLVGNLAYYVAGVFTLAVPFLVYLVYSGSLAHYLRICFVDVPFLLYKNVHNYRPPLLPGLSFSRPLSPAPYGRIELSTTGKTILFYVSACAFLYCLVGLIRKARRDKLSECDLNLLNLVTFGIPSLWLGSRLMVVGTPQFFYCLPPAIIAGCYLGDEALSKLVAYVKSSSNKGSLRTLVVWAINLVPVALIAVIGWNVYVKGTDSSLFFLKGKAAERAAQRDEAALLSLERAGGVLVPQGQAAVVEQVVEFLKKNTGPQEKIYVFPQNGVYNFLADRDSATRFPITIYAAARPEYRREVVESLRKERPEFVIYDTNAFVLTIDPRVPPEEQLPFIFGYIMANYQVEKVVGPTLILRRRG